MPATLNNFDSPFQDVRYDVTPSAIKVHNSKAKTKCISGPVGSGKTSVACMEFYIMCLVSKVSIRGVVIRESYRELQDSTRQTFFEWFGNEGLGLADYKEGDETATLTLEGLDGVTRTHELLFRACRRESEATKFLSTEFAFLWLEEVCPAFSNKGVMGQGLPKGIYEVGHLRIRQKGAPYLEVLVTCNPPPARHWVYKEFFQITPEIMAYKDYALIRQPAYENKKNLPDGYYEGLERILPPDMARRFIKGESVTVYEGERVFPECKDNYHVVDHVEPIPGLPLVLGQDYGLTPCTLITQIAPGGQWRWLREVQLWNSGIRNFVNHLIPVLKDDFKGYQVRVVWQDPQGGNARSQVDESTCAEVMRAAGFTVQDGDNNWTLRKETMKSRFEVAPDGEPGVLLSRYGCPVAAEGVLGGYRYPKSSEGIVGTSPIKNEFSHILDAAQMIAVGEFSVLSGMAKTEEKRRQADVIPLFNPLNKPRTRHSNRHAWLGR